MAVAISLLAIVAAYLSTGPLAALKNTTGADPPEARRKRYDAKILRKYLSPESMPTRSALGATTPPWQLYRAALQWDIMFAILFGLGLAVILDGTLGAALRSPGSAWWLLLIPIAAGTVDVVEDTLLLRAVRGEGIKPVVSEEHVRSAWKTTQLKWLLVIASLGLILVGTIALGIGGGNGWTPPPLGLIALTALTLAFQPLALRYKSEDPVRRRAVVGLATIIFSLLMIWLGPCPRWWSAGNCLTEGPASVVASLGRGVFWGILVGGFIAGAFVIARSIPAIAKKMRDERSEKLNDSEVPLMAVLILVGTALPEEVIFRGVLFTAWENVGDVVTAIVMPSIAFGLWHIAPERERIKDNPTGPGARSGIWGGVAFTAVGGVFFGILRAATDAIWAGVIVHAALNISALYAARAASLRRRGEG